MGTVVLTFLELRSELTGGDKKCSGVLEEPAGAPWEVVFLKITFLLLRLRDLWEAGGNKNSKGGFV